MAHRPARTIAVAAAACALALPTPTLGHSDSTSPSPDPHAGHQMPSPAADPHAGHEMPLAEANPYAGHGTEPDHAGRNNHGRPGEDGGHEHERLPDTVTPEVRNLVLSGFAGVNVAVVFGAWLARRTRPGDPDPRKRQGKASR